MRGRSAFLPATALVLALTACSGADASDAETRASVVTVPPVSTSAAPPTTPAATDTPAPELNERGNVVLEVGEPSVIHRAGDPAAPVAFEFTVEELVVNPECDSGFEQEPETGNYLGIRLQVQTSGDYDPREVQKISEYDFGILRPDGTPLPEVIGNGQTCFAESDEMSHQRFGPGERYEGWIVLDMPIRAGTVVYAPAGQPYGWEWEY